MAQFRGDPLLAELQSLSDEMDRRLGRMSPSGSRGWLPPADVYETEEEVVIALDVPGCRFEDLAVEAIDGQLVIAGERDQPRNVARRYRSERWSGKFVRSFALQPTLRTEDIHAEYHDGVLQISLRKPEETKPKRISISRQPDSVDTIEVESQAAPA